MRVEPALESYSNARSIMGALNVVFRVGTLACALPVAVVIETMRAQPLDGLSGVADCVLGLAMIRGTPTPVLDASKLFGDRPSTAARLITVRVSERTVALAVDEVIGVYALGEETLHPLPPLLATAAAGTIDGIAALDGELLVMLEQGRMISDELLAALEATR